MLSNPCPADTSRLSFRCWRASDFALASGLWGDSQVTALIGGPFSPEQVQARLAAEMEHRRYFRVQYWPIFLSENGVHVGCSGLRPYQVEQHIYEFGVHLRPAFWAKGLATEAARAVISHGFEKLHAEALFAGHHPANQLSLQLLLKLGFVYTHDEFYNPTGLMHPAVPTAALR